MEVRAKEITIEGIACKRLLVRGSQMTYWPADTLSPLQARWSVTRWRGTWALRFLGEWPRLRFETVGDAVLYAQSYPHRGRDAAATKARAVAAVG